jgi:hypothetical protein
MAKAFVRELSNGKPAFEVLEAPEGAGNVLHFRLTGWLPAYRNAMKLVYTETQG